MNENIKKELKKALKESLLSSLAALLILGLIQPFGIDRITRHRELYVLGEVGLVFFSILIAHVVLMCIPAYRNFQSKTIWHELLKRVPRLLIFVPLLAFALDCFNFWYCDCPIEWAWHAEDGSFSLVPWAWYCLWILIISIFIQIWELYRWRNNQLEQELVDVRAINALLEERQQQLADASELPAAEEHPHAQVVLQGNAQNATLDICPDDIIYIESMSNYADIVYIDGGETRHTTLRITLKQLREQLADAECLVQCHRAFLVNLNFVRNLSVRSAGTYELELFGMEKKVPVSRTNADAMKHHLEH